MSWEPPHDECPSCKFYREKRPDRRCRFCGVGEFFEPNDGEEGIDEVLKFYADGSIERQPLTESRLLEIIERETDDNEDR